MNSICGAVSRAPPHPRWKYFRFFLNFKQDCEAKRHYLVECNYCGGFAQGRFAFIMFIQMFILIFFHLREQVALLLSVCVSVFPRVGGLLESSDKLKEYAI